MAIRKGYFTRHNPSAKALRFIDANIPSKSCNTNLTGAILEENLPKKRGRHVDNIGIAFYFLQRLHIKFTMLQANTI